MNNNLEDLMYKAGLTAQGCWDSMDQYDRDSIMKLTELVVEDCIKLIKESGKQCKHTTFDKSIVDCTKRSAVKLVKQHFCINDHKETTC